MKVKTISTSCIFHIFTIFFIISPKLSCKNYFLYLRNVMHLYSLVIFEMHLQIWCLFFGSCHVYPSLSTAAFLTFRVSFFKFIYLIYLDRNFERFPYTAFFIIFFTIFTWTFKSFVNSAKSLFPNNCFTKYTYSIEDIHFYSKVSQYCSLEN